MTKDKNRVCPVERAGSLDNKFRTWLQNPQKILAPYVKEGMKVLDLGCGPGFYTIELAKIVGKTGKVFAVDLQDGMLEKVRDKIAGTELNKLIDLIKCEADEIVVPEKVDFVLAFYMVHEVPDKEILFHSLKNILKEEGRFLIVEPKLFHVSKKEFGLTIEKAEKVGFRVIQRPRVLFSFSAILEHAEKLRRY